VAAISAVVCRSSCPSASWQRSIAGTSGPTSLPALVSSMSRISLCLSSTLLCTLSPTNPLPFLAQMPRIGVSERELGLAALLQRLDGFALLGADRRHLSAVAVAGVVVLQRGRVGVNRAIEPGQVALQTGAGLDAVGTGAGVEKAAVDADRRTPDQIELATQLHKLAVQRLQRLGVVAAEVGDAMIARTQTAEQPDRSCRHRRQWRASGYPDRRGPRRAAVAASISIHRRDAECAEGPTRMQPSSLRSLRLCGESNAFRGRRGACVRSAGITCWVARKRAPTLAGSRGS
jgi:hypothetical protein